MKINCTNKWLEALNYFLCPTTLAKLQALGLTVQRMDWANQQVILGADSPEQLQVAVEGVAKIAERTENVWSFRIAAILAEEPLGTSKRRLLESVAKQIEKYGNHIPTEAQQRILRPIWLKHQHRQVESVIG